MLEAGIELLQEQPLVSRLTARAVARRAGLTTGSYYYYWEGQESYIKDLLTHRLGERRYQWLAQVEKRVRRLVAQGASFDEIVTKAARWGLDSIERDPVFALQVGLWAQYAADPKSAEALAQLYREFNEHFLPLYRRVLESADLELRPPFTAEHAAILVTALVEGLVLQRRVDRAAVPENLFGAALLALAASIVQPRSAKRGLAETLLDRLPARLPVPELKAR
jgi:AcrR family transcriptional regulator